MPRTPAVNALAVLAWLNVGLHAAGLALAAAGMRPGTPLVPLPERLDYLAAAPLGWTLGWVSWMLCAVLLIAFLAALTGRLRERRELARLGLTVAVAGAAFDLFCDAVLHFTSMGPRPDSRGCGEQARHGHRQPGYRASMGPRPESRGYGKQAKPRRPPLQTSYSKSTVAGNAGPSRPGRFRRRPASPESRHTPSG